MPVTLVGPEEFAQTLEAFAAVLRQTLQVPTDLESALRAATLLIACMAIDEKALFYRRLARKLEGGGPPVLFVPRVPRGAGLC